MGLFRVGRAGQFAAERVAAGQAMVDKRAVFGTPEDVADQLRRYADVVDLALPYPPQFGVNQDRIHANELSNWAD